MLILLSMCIWLDWICICQCYWLDLNEDFTVSQAVLYNNANITTYSINDTNVINSTIFDNDPVNGVLSFGSYSHFFIDINFVDNYVISRINIAWIPKQESVCNITFGYFDILSQQWIENSNETTQFFNFSTIDNIEYGYYVIRSSFITNKLTLNISFDDNNVDLGLSMIQINGTISKLQ